MQRLSSTVSPTGTTTLPKVIRKALGLEGGGRIDWLFDEDGHLTVRVRHRYVGGAVVAVDAFGADARMIDSADAPLAAAPSRPPPTPMP